VSKIGEDLNKDLLLKVVGSARGKALTVDEVMTRAGIDEGARVLARRLLRELTRDGALQADGKRFRSVDSETPTQLASKPAASKKAHSKQAPAHVPPREAAGPVRMDPSESNEGDAPRASRRDPSLFRGTFRRHREGYGFVTPLEGGEGLFVPFRVAEEALDGDLVEARMGPGRDERPVAVSLQVVERRRQLAVGLYCHDRARNEAWVEPRDPSLPPIRVSPTRLVAEGDVVRVRVEGLRRGEAHGTVDGRLGRPGDADAEVLSVAYGEGFDDRFPPPVLAAAEAIPEQVRDEDVAGRRDLTAMPLVTIDGEDARDFDDAVYVEPTAEGHRLVVAIADVTAYVTPGGALDDEARRRATSVYFPGHVLPMLPERLSNGICSLNPGVRRLCMVADMRLGARAELLGCELYPAVMLSQARCTYTQVAALLAGDPSAAELPWPPHIVAMLREAAVLAGRLNAARSDRGAIDFDVPEPYVRLGEGHSVLAIERRPRNEAHRLIEAFMLAANEAVAGSFESWGLPTIFRIHGAPREEKLEAFVNLAAAYGYEIGLDAKGRVGAAALNDFLARVEGRPEQKALNHLLLRAMMQAAYSAGNIGHFGLAAGSYLHFTSPIRRYPDLIVHRLLKEHWLRGGTIPREQVLDRQQEGLEVTAQHCSERERAATAAEREVDAYYAAVLMQARVGERFEGTISGVTEAGLFVALDSPAVDGMIAAESIGAAAQLDTALHRLVFGRGGGLSFGVGERVEVEVVSADPLRRRIALRLAGATAPRTGGRAVVGSGRSLRQAIDDRRKPAQKHASNAGPRGKGSGGKKPAGGKGGGRGGRRK